MKGQRSAFTLIELAIVIAIIVIMAATVPIITSGVVLDRQMYNMAAQLQQDLLLVQNMAITHSSGGPSITGGTRFVMRLYVAEKAFAYQTTESPTSLAVSNPTPDTGIVVRRMSSAFGFPASFGNTPLASVTIGSSTTVMSGYVDVVFDNQGLPYWSVNGGSWTSGGTAGTIMIVNGSLSKQMQVDVSVIGRVSIAWKLR